MKSLVLAEKPSVGKEIGRVLECSNRQKSHWENSSYIVTWAMGHLVELAEPSAYSEKYKKWSLDDLPMLPGQMKYKVIRRSSQQFRAIKELLHRKDINQVIIATDAGREGELVARLIMRLGGWKGEYKRLWISSQTDSAIKAGFAGLKPGKAYDNLFHAAECRAEADWIVGLNISRALSCKFDARLSAGRVQTPTLAMIVTREKEIKGFVPVPYWTVSADLGMFTGLWQSPNGNSRISNDKAAGDIAAKVSGKSGVIISVDRKKKSEPPPLAFDLTALQREANVQLGFSARKTLQVLQGLYERHKYATYPRTDSRHITEDMEPTLPARLQAITNTPFGGTVSQIRKKPIKPGKRFIDGSKVSDHHAIIPTEEPVDLSRLDADERSLWTMIARRFLAVLSPPYLYETTKLIVEINGERFAAHGSSVTDPGWRRVESYRADSGGEEIHEQTLGKREKGETVIAEKVKAKQSFSKPPARYTEATLLGAMENPGKFIKSKELKESISRGGLGTPATRAEIIEKLISSGYIEREGKSLQPTPRGTELLELIPGPLRSPVLTAEWEQRLVQIEKGRESAGKFSQDIRKNAVDLVAEVKNSSAEYKPKNTTGKSCPLCGKPLMTLRSGKGRNGGEKLVCHSLACGYEEEPVRDSGGRGSRPSHQERSTARRYMGEYGAKGSETSTFADLLKASQKNKRKKDS
ncbi:MAG: DNA topoisomerase III [Spirochaetales bacterium]|jgi:DNA topoisomerase III|nr:DNA topoisomerase III [Spirochaetales bacterium]